jgi:putative transposase
MQLISLIRLFFSSRPRLIAENLFLRKQLALFQERQTKPGRAPAGTRLAMIALAKFFNWREALAVIQLDTFIRRHDGSGKPHLRSVQHYVTGMRVNQ